jgi:multiple sugar transport system substrate-binding protein
MNPIEVFERLSGRDEWAYCPLLYGYSNYARPGYRRHVVRGADIPALGEEGPCGSQIGGTGLAISARCRAVEVAVDYAFWVAGAACQKGLYFTSGGQPGNAVAWQDDGVNAASNDFFRDTRETLERSWLRPRYDGFLEFQDRGGDIVNAFLRGEAGADQTLDRLDQAYRESRR